ncbi:MAG: flagellar motor switch phosphatase FliY [Candidatus Saccharibacteria bacterium]
MNDGILSQDEIDALLKGDSKSSDYITSDNGSDVNVTEIEKDALGEIGNISMGTSATTLSTLLGKKVRITTPRVKTCTKEQLQTEYPLPHVVIEVQYREGLQGSNVLVMKKDDVQVIADLMMGGDGTTQRELDDLTLSAVSEAMNQMMGSSTTSLSSMFDKRIDIAPPSVAVIDFATDELGVKLGDEFSDMVQISFRMEIEGLIDSEIMQIMPIDSAKSMVASLMGGVPEADVNVLSEPEPTYTPPPMTAAPPPPPMPDYAAPPSMPEYAAVPPPQAGGWYGGAMPPQMDASSGQVKKGQQVAVQPVQFMPLQAPGVYAAPQNIDLILDVPLDLSVELGKTKKSIKEILEMGPGSIIQLDKLAGEPVDLLVNGKLIAKGEVVVIDESYGIRITAIVSPMDRLAKLQ